MSFQRSLFAIAIASTVTFAAVDAPCAQTGVAGEWTNCVAWQGNVTYNIVNGTGTRDRCFQLARKCTGNPNVTVTFYNPAVLVNAPYQRCAAN